MSRPADSLARALFPRAPRVATAWRPRLSPGGRSISGAELRPSSTRGLAAPLMTSPAVPLMSLPGLRLTHSKRSVTEAERPDPGLSSTLRGNVPDDEVWLLESPWPCPSSGFSKSADLGRCFLRVLKSIALDNILNGFLLPGKYSS